MASSSGSTATLGERLGRGDNGASDGAKESVFFPPAGRPGKVWLESSESTTVGQSAGERREALAFLVGRRMIVAPFLTAFEDEAGIDRQMDEHLVDEESLWDDGAIMTGVNTSKY